MDIAELCEAAKRVNCEVMAGKPDNLCGTSVLDQTAWIEVSPAVYRALADRIKSGPDTHPKEKLESSTMRLCGLRVWVDEKVRTWRIGRR